MLSFVPVAFFSTKTNAQQKGNANKRLKKKRAQIQIIQYAFTNANIKNTLIFDAAVTLSLLAVVFLFFDHITMDDSNDYMFLVM